MKGIYITQDLRQAIGIWAKIQNQVKTLKKIGADVEFLPNSKRSMFTFVRYLVPIFSKQYFNIDVDWKEQDFVYIRKGAVIDASVLRLLKKIKKENPSIKLLFEVPTYPYIAEFPWFVKWLIQIKEYFVVPKLKRYIDRIITYSKDETIFDIPCIRTANAYEFNHSPTVQKDKEALHLFAVGNLAFYHGYDRLIRGLDRYYKDGSDNKCKIIFTIVGEGKVLQYYQKLVDEYRLNDVIYLVGKKIGIELEQYYKWADIGIDALGCHRKNVAYVSSLKGKEYLAKGIPIVSGVETEMDAKRVDFYFRVPADDSPIDVGSVLKFYNQLETTKKKQDLANEIYNFGKNNYSFVKTFEPIHEFLKK